MADSLWQDSRVKFYNRIVRSHDFNLFARRNHLGIICIYRKSKKLEFVFAGENCAYYATKDSPQFVCALTENWKTNSKPREWGADNLLDYIKGHDTWNIEEFFQRMDDHNEKVKKSKERSFKNETEAFFSDTRSLFKKDYNDIRTSNLDKSEKRRRLIEKSLEAKEKKIKEI